MSRVSKSMAKKIAKAYAASLIRTCNADIFLDDLPEDEAELVQIELLKIADSISLLNGGTVHEIIKKIQSTD